MILPKLNGNKVFVSGPSGGGKTFFAKEYSKQHGIPYVSFDQVFSYVLQGEPQNATKVLAELPEKGFIIDAIPYIGELKNISLFLEYASNKSHLEVCVVLAFCTDREGCKKRLSGKIRAGSFEMSGFLSQYEMVAYFLDYGSYLEGVSLVYYDSFHNDFITKEVLLERLSWLQPTINLLKAKIGSLRKYVESRNYDKWYQDIDCLDIKGYSDSAKYWKMMRYLISWDGKTVADLGGFHGCFAFKIAKLGGKVFLLDKSSDVLETARRINEIEETDTQFLVWEGGEPLPMNFDVVLCLNMLHHCKDPETTLRHMFCKQALFRVKLTQKYLVFRYFDLVTEIRTDEDRSFFLAKRKGI